MFYRTTRLLITPPPPSVVYAARCISIVCTFVVKIISSSLSTCPSSLMSMFYSISGTERTDGMSHGPLFPPHPPPFPGGCNNDKEWWMTMGLTCDGGARRSPNLWKENICSVPMFVKPRCHCCCRPIMTYSLGGHRRPYGVAINEYPEPPTVRPLHPPCCREADTLELY